MVFEFSVAPSNSLYVSLLSRLQSKSISLALFEVAIEATSSELN